MRRLTFFLFVFGILFADGLPVFCQQSKSVARVNVTVTDPLRAPIPRARVRITARQRELETDNQGKVSVALSPGNYDFLISEQGFRNFSKMIVLDGTETTPIDAVLQVGTGGGPTVVRNFDQTPEERAVWRLENSYWEYVKALDFENYKSLWHPNFIGWPYVSAVPVPESAITDWISQYQAKGLRL